MCRRVLDQLAAALSPFRPHPPALSHCSIYPQAAEKAEGAQASPTPSVRRTHEFGLKIPRFRERTLCGQLPGMLGGQPVSRFRARNGSQGYPQIWWMMAGVTSAPERRVFPLEPVSRLP